jgi:hypothetical protein
LQGQKQQGAVAPPGPGGLVGGGKKSLSLLVVEEVDDRAGGTLPGMARTRWMVAVCSGTWRLA